MAVMHYLTEPVFWFQRQLCFVGDHESFCPDIDSIIYCKISTNKGRPTVDP